ncbi:NEK/NEK1 protein kinase [Thecamonas trahens ATCC 50062]|uniref:non-specific serine/threonine protein kinase n=1 Tax=Thecamonas trahens ATCC 50062 TaxID=461836 RepID=A0A0L0D929_THETB|nr:NEK/NEK1 protein kinase [Thecamonas trahens ATCC 50062]KNC48740.1 NEK/NEK1 protein kinase [Thecamonas trahens ATCC 50062]|eukprot:XP_013762792.1 NEK/NEK1 protein kinase [Thecamonas trahens ATCC 50062]
MDRYDIVQTIGQGASGTAFVVREKDNAQGKLLCIKQMTTSTFNEREQQNAINEIKVMKQLDNPFIVAYHDSFEEGEHLHIALDERNGEYLDEEQILDWFCQLCLAVKHCHDRRILHRDLKTENIFLSEDKQIKLGDFGLVRTLQSSMDMARTAAGTPYYLSPEICNGETYNSKSDVWALGCVLYKLLTFRHAFQTDSLPVLIRKIVSGDYAPIPRTFSSKVRALVDWIFTSNPEERPSVYEILLNTPFLKSRIPKFLSDEQIQIEFGSEYQILDDLQEDEHSDLWVSFSSSDDPNAPDAAPRSSRSSLHGKDKSKSKSKDKSKSKSKSKDKSKSKSKSKDKSKSKSKAKEKSKSKDKSSRPSSRRGDRSSHRSLRREPSGSSESRSRSRSRHGSHRGSSSRHSSHKDKSKAKSKAKDKEKSRSGSRRGDNGERSRSRSRSHR